MSITASDSDNVIKSTLALTDHDGDGEFCVPNRVILDALKELPEQPSQVPLIMVPDSSPRASKGVWALAWRFCWIFAGELASSGYVWFRWVRASASVGCIPRGLRGVV